MKINRRLTVGLLPVLGLLALGGLGAKAAQELSVDDEFTARSNPAARHAANRRGKTLQSGT